MEDSKEKDKQMDKLKKLAKKEPALRYKIRSYEMAEKKRTVTIRIKTYEDACKEIGVEPIPKRIKGEPGDTKRIEAIYKMSVIVQALNGGRRFRARNPTMEHWYPKFRFCKPGLTLTFSKSVCDLGEICALSGTLLGLKTKELSDYCGKQFIKLWEEIIV